ncbi:MAG: nuclear transport factor 2 family protein [Aridibacter famidurans]|nr:nuclear transport factor 2 family protein [Aridibacter famidurans]
MRKLLALALLSFVLMFTACPDQASPTNTGEANNANNAASPSGEDASAAVIELEKKAHEAWKSKDGKFFEGMLADDFMGVVGGNIVDKAGLVKQISESPCTVASAELSDPKTVKLTDNAMLVTHKVSFDYSCEGKKVKSPEYAASVYVKEGDAWKGAYHQSLTAANAEGELESSPDTAALKGTDDDNTQALQELENEAWEAWSKGDTKWFEEHMASNALHISPDGVTGRDAMIKALGEMNCEVEEYQLRAFTGTKLAENVHLLMYAGEQEAKCGDTQLPPTVIGSTVAVKDGDKWKLYFHVETPAK